MYAQGKNSSNGDHQNNGQGKDPRIIRGEKIRDPFKERRLSFRIKEKGEEPLFLLVARGACTVELNTTDSFDAALKLIRKVTQLDPYSVKAARAGYDAWIADESNKADRLVKIALIQGIEIDLVNLVRYVATSHLNADMTVADLQRIIHSDAIDTALIDAIKDRIEKRRA